MYVWTIATDSRLDGLRRRSVDCAWIMISQTHDFTHASRYLQPGEVPRQLILITHFLKLWYLFHIRICVFEKLAPYHPDRQNCHRTMLFFMCWVQYSFFCAFHCKHLCILNSLLLETCEEISQVWWFESWSDHANFFPLHCFMKSGGHGSFLFLFCSHSQTSLCHFFLKKHKFSDPWNRLLQPSLIFSTADNGVKQCNQSIQQTKRLKNGNNLSTNQSQTPCSLI